LAALVDRYAPEYAGFLRQEGRSANAVPLHRPASYLPELTDDLVGDLDDAA
jgi:exosome complex RNA-binding protein Rrp4